MTPKFLDQIHNLSDSMPAFRALLLSDTLVLLAEVSRFVILPWWIASSGGANALALYSIATAVATFLIVPIASPFGDRYCKAKQITLGLAVLVVAAMALVCLANAEVFSLAFLTFVGWLQVAALAFVDSARSTILAELVHPDQLPTAIRLRKTCQAIAGIVGPLIAGLALTTMGTTRSLCLYAMLLVAALFFAKKIPKSDTGPSPQRGFRRWWRELAGGLSAKWQVPMERGWTAVNFLVWIFQGPLVGMLIPIRVHTLGLSAGWLGSSLCALSLGILFGSLFGSEYLVNRFGRYRVRIGLAFLEGICLAVVGFLESPTLMVCGLAFAGFCNASMALVGATHRALAIPKTYRVRLFAASSMTTQVAGSIGPAIVGFALTQWSVNAVYSAFGLLMATSVLGLLFVPRLNEFLSLEHDQVHDWYLHQYPASFK